VPPLKFQCDDKAAEAFHSLAVVNLPTDTELEVELSCLLCL